MGETDKDDLISIIEEDDPEAVIPTTLPLMPVRDVVIFTDMLLPLFVGREKSVSAIEESLAKDRYLFVATQNDPGIENPKPEEIYQIGTVGRILRMLKLPDGRVKALVQGIAKARIVKYVRKRSVYRVKIDIIVEPDSSAVDLETEALMRNVREYSEKILTLRGEYTSEVGSILTSIEDPGRLADLVASNLRLKIDEAQAILEIIDPFQRLKKVNDLLFHEVELSAMQAKIQSEVKDEISKSQRDYFLREQVRAIHKELGELDERTQEIEEYRNKIKRAKMSQDAKDEADKQLNRLEQMHPDSAESSVVRTYLDWMVDLPWSKATKDMIDIKKAKTVLDLDHYGLDKIKDRILEYLSVRKLNPKIKGPILCFVGPPGVGKTSLGPGHRQGHETEIRAHLPGRDTGRSGNSRASPHLHRRPARANHPGIETGRHQQPGVHDGRNRQVGRRFSGRSVFGASGSAGSGAEHAEFSDHYLNLPFDLSKVMFILTANISDTIPSALLDRMEIINLSGYTEDEEENHCQNTT